LRPFAWTPPSARKWSAATTASLNTNELPKLYGGAGLKILRYEEPLGVADFTKEKLRLVKLVAQKTER
jgi:hypothetical protein